MNHELIFSLLNLSVFPAWALLIFLPRAGVTRSVVHSGLYPVIIGLFYAISFGLNVFGGYAAEDGSFFTVAGISALFQHPVGVMIGWSHYLVFDLFVGAWIGRDAQRRGIAHWITVPCLLFTFIFGPIGLLLYVIARVATGKGWALWED